MHGRLAAVAGVRAANADAVAALGLGGLSTTRVLRRGIHSFLTSVTGILDTAVNHAQGWQTGLDWDPQR
jgi:hypothetical protein